MHPFEQLIDQCSREEIDVMIEIKEKYDLKQLARIAEEDIIFANEMKTWDIKANLTDSEIQEFIKDEVKEYDGYDFLELYDSLEPHVQNYVTEDILEEQINAPSSFPVNTLDDQFKYELLRKAYKKLTLRQLEIRFKYDELENVVL